ncbi:MAG: hypothetical protein Q8L64_02940 [bacterium]|nr:hypothetical protein [bacterium]
MSDFIYLHFWGKKIFISIDYKCYEIKKYLLQLRHISGIPVQVQISSNPNQELECPTLHIFASDTPKLEFLEQNQTLNLYINWQTIENRVSSLSNIIGQLISLACVNSYEFPLHSAVVARDGKAYFILGASGAGKTNLSLALCKKNNFLWLANDWSALRLDRNSVIVSQGYDLINFRTASINQIADYLPVPVIEQIQDNHNDAMDFSRKSRFYHSDEVEIQKADLPLLVSRMYFVQIAQNEEKKITQLAPNEIIEKLTYEFFWVLRGLGSFLISHSSEVILPSVVMCPLRNASR